MTAPLRMKNVRRLNQRRYWLLLLAALAILGPLGAGCGPRPVVSDTPTQAMTDGKAKEEAAQKAEEAKSTEAPKLWGEVAAYYGAVAGKFPNPDTSLAASRAEARIYSEKLKNDYQGFQVLRKAVKAFGASDISEKSAAQADLVALEQKLDNHNSTQWGFKVMDTIVHILGNNPTWSPVAAIFFIAIFVTAILHPLRFRQYRFFKEMQRYAPALKKLQEENKDPLVLAEKQRAFYKEHGVNQLMGCLPMVLQMPIFFLMYQTILQYQFHFTSTSFLWMNSASGAWSLTLPPPLTGALAHNLGEQDLLLLLVYVGSMFLQMKLTPPPADPQQAEQQKMMGTFMPIMYFFMMLNWQPAAAFVLYWITSSLLGLAQQAYINRQLARMNFGAPIVLGASSSGSSSAGSANPSAPTTLSANDRLISPKNRRSSKAKK